MDDEFEPISSEGEREALVLRTVILEGIASIDGWLSDQFAYILGRDVSTQTVLASKVLPRVPIMTRYEALIQVLEWREELDEYPFIGLLKPVIGDRNILAHMSMDIFESTDDNLVFTGYKNGEFSIRHIPMKRLRDSQAIVGHTLVDLRLLSGSVTQADYEEALTKVKELFAT